MKRKSDQEGQTLGFAPTLEYGDTLVTGMGGGGSRGG